jgi:TatD DNase family protein
MLIDTHCHITLLLNEKEWNTLSDLDYEKAHVIIKQAQINGVNTIITIGSTNQQDSINCNLLAKKFHNVFAAIGIFPHDSKSTWQQDLEQLIPLIECNDKIVAIGECGLDFHYPDYQEKRQKDVFKAQIELALKYNKAIIIHTRNAPEETLRIIDEYKNNLPRGVFHCFSEDLEFAKYIIDLGFFIGITATVTYPKNNRLREIIATVGLEHIVLETDSPFLPPQHMRGKQNHPREILTVAQCIAQTINMPVEKVAQITTANAQTLFRLPQ